MSDPFEWQEYKDKVDELTRKLEELTSQVKEDSSEEEEGFSPLFSGNQATPRSRQPIMHYAGHMGDDVSIGNYADLRDKFEDFVEDSASYLKPGVQQFDVITATMGAAQDNVYCLLTIEDGTFQSEGPTPYAGSDPWNYHIWSSASGSGGGDCCCLCEEPNDATLSFTTTSYGGLTWSNVSYDLAACAYVATTTSATPSDPLGPWPGNFTMECKYTADRGWTIILTADQLQLVKANHTYTGGGDHFGSGYPPDLDDDYNPCNVDILSHASAGLFIANSKSITAS